MDHLSVTYSLDCDFILDASRPFRRLAFVPAHADPVAALSNRGTRRVHVHETRPATELTQAKVFWYVQYVETPPTVICTVLDTAEVLQILDRGRMVLVISGPFATKDAAQHDMDVRWDSQDSD